MHGALTHRQVLLQAVTSASGCAMTCLRLWRPSTRPSITGCLHTPYRCDCPAACLEKARVKRVQFKRAALLGTQKICSGHGHGVIKNDTALQCQSFHRSCIQVQRCLSMSAYNYPQLQAGLYPSRVDAPPCGATIAYEYHS